MAPTKGSAPAVCAARGAVELAAWIERNSDTGKAARQARLRAELQKRGYLLSERKDGGFFISRWDRLTDARDLESVEGFLRRLGGST